MKIISIFIFLFSAVASAELPPPYDQVDPLPYNPQGWYNNGKTMEQLIKTRNVKVVIEVGSWLGLSTMHIAKTLPQEGIVYAVDHWMGSAFEDNSSYDMSNLFRQFLSNIIHQNLTDKIVPIRMTSVEAAKTLKIKPDLVYIDASHDFFNVFRDLVIWYPFVKGHGVLCGDDYYLDHYLDRGGPAGQVKTAVDLFAHENRLIVHTDGWMWYLEEN